MRVATLRTTIVVLKVATLIVYTTLLTNCVRPVTEQMVDTNPQGWVASDGKVVYYDNKDTLSLKQIDILVRFDAQFGYDKLALAVTTTTPAGYSWRDTVYVPFRWADTEISTFVESRTKFRKDVRFDTIGNYRFSLTPIMPDIKTKGVVAVGVDI